MYSTMDKALAAAILGVASLLNIAGYHPAWLTADSINGALAVITPILVYLIPNKT